MFYKIKIFLRNRKIKKLKIGESFTEVEKYKNEKYLRTIKRIDENSIHLSGYFVK